MDIAQSLDRVKLEVAERMRDQGAGHGLDHVRRVVNLSRQLQRSEGGDGLIIELAAWLHDVGDAKFWNGVERGDELSTEIMHTCHVPAAFAAQVIDIVNKISFRKQIPSNELSWEGKIVQDADRLDALGAIGIVRTIEYGAFANQPFYDPAQELHTSRSGLGHFYQKLFQLRELLNTATARLIAAQREAFMRQFVDQFLSEWRVAEEEEEEVKP